jgi:hypothetical protein
MLALFIPKWCIEFTWGGDGDDGEPRFSGRGSRLLLILDSQALPHHASLARRRDRNNRHIVQRDNAGAALRQQI